MQTAEGGAVPDTGTTPTNSGGATGLSAKPSLSGRNSAIARHSSLGRKTSLAAKSTLSRRSTVKDSANGRTIDNPDSVYYRPLPLGSDPANVLADRFVAWTNVLESLISYFEGIKSVELKRATELQKCESAFNPPFEDYEFFLHDGGIQDTGKALKEALEFQLSEISGFLTRLNDDILPMLRKMHGNLARKIKIIRSLGPTFKDHPYVAANELQRTQIGNLGEALASWETSPERVTPKTDPYILHLSVERQIRQSNDAEQDLQSAYFDLQRNGRKLESNVLETIQQAFNIYNNALRTESRRTIALADKIQETTASIPLDREWTAFVNRDPTFIDEDMPFREFSHLEYPGQTHVAVKELRKGLLERKSRYLRNYSPGMYVLSAAGFMYEFKPKTEIYDQTPGMALFLPNCTLGKHADEGATSHSFKVSGPDELSSLKNRHTWTFRAESHSEMLLWYNDIQHLMNLPNLSSRQWSEFLQSHQQQQPEELSAPEADEADQVPFAAIQEEEETGPTTEDKGAVAPTSALAIGDRAKSTEPPRSDIDVAFSDEAMGEGDNTATGYGTAAGVGAAAGLGAGAMAYAAHDTNDNYYNNEYPAGQQYENQYAGGTGYGNEPYEDTQYGQQQYSQQQYSQQQYGQQPYSGDHQYANQYYGDEGYGNQYSGQYLNQNDTYGRNSGLAQAGMAAAGGAIAGGLGGAALAARRDREEHTDEEQQIPEQAENETSAGTTETEKPVENAGEENGADIRGASSEALVSGEPTSDTAITTGAMSFAGAGLVGYAASKDTPSDALAEEPAAAAAGEVPDTEEAPEKEPDTATQNEHESSSDTIPAAAVATGAGATGAAAGALAADKDDEATNVKDDQSTVDAELNGGEPAVTNKDVETEAETEPVETEPAQTEPVQTEPVETEPVQSEADGNKADVAIAGAGAAAAGAGVGVLASDSKPQDEESAGEHPIKEAEVDNTAESKQGIFSSSVPLGTHDPTANDARDAYYNMADIKQTEDEPAHDTENADTSGENAGLVAGAGAAIAAAGAGIATMAGLSSKEDDVEQPDSAPNNNVEKSESIEAPTETNMTAAGAAGSSGIGAGTSMSDMLNESSQKAPASETETESPFKATEEAITAGITEAGAAVAGIAAAAGAGIAAVVGLDEGEPEHTEEPAGETEEAKMTDVHDHENLVLPAADNDAETVSTSAAASAAPPPALSTRSSFISLKPEEMDAKKVLTEAV